MNNFNRNVLLWIVIAVFLFGLFNMFQGGQDRSHLEEVPYSTFKDDLEKGSVDSVEIRG